MRGRIVALCLIVLAAVAAIAQTTLGDDPDPIVQVAGGDPERGKAAIERYGCTSCHLIPGLDAPMGRVGPPLADFAERRYIAGDEPNTLRVMLRWLQDPQDVEPGTLMPDVGVTPTDARDIAAYLYSDP